MATALTMLSDEHKNILKVLDALSEECDALQSGKKIDGDFFSKAIGFARGYADKFHHAKEEEILFVELCKNEAQMHCNPTQQMVYEHELGRGFIRRLEKGVEDKNKKMVIENARGYVQLLRDHIFKEENILYPMADKALSKEAKKKMLEKFKQAEKKLIAERDKHLLFVRKLEKRAL